MRIPAGVEDGQRIRVKGRGAAGRNGGPPGDLYVMVHVGPHPIFGRRGKQPHRQRAGDLPRGRARHRVKVPTLDGPVTVKVPAGHPRARRSASTGRGVHPAKGAAGDLLVTFDVDVPTALTDEQRAAVEVARARRGADEPRRTPRRVT